MFSYNLDEDIKVFKDSLKPAEAPAAESIGYIAVILMSILGVIIVIIDITTLHKHIR